ncbi:hypothetical protein PF011_g25460 [Phytophthora fragariae]|uniref:Uncharacterized protein n=1 Tax=Phytophthora fragariae TaxID=53985 RepID=A0A6A3HYC6_9STRA|nr:hypothetical protein PF011_g25460 [Phytophthora fragariae]
MVTRKVKTPAYSDKTGGGRGYGVDQGREEGPGRRKKVAVEPTSDSDDEKREVELKVVALSDDVKRRFGQTKFLVFFFVNNKFGPVSFKMFDPRKLEEMTLMDFVSREGEIRGDNGHL